MASDRLFRFGMAMGTGLPMSALPAMAVRSLGDSSRAAIARGALAAMGMRAAPYVVAAPFAYSAVTSLMDRDVTGSLTNAALAAGALFGGRALFGRTLRTAADLRASRRAARLERIKARRDQMAATAQSAAAAQAARANAAYGNAYGFNPEYISSPGMREYWNYSL